MRAIEPEANSPLASRQSQHKPTRLPMEARPRCPRLASSPARCWPCFFQSLVKDFLERPLELDCRDEGLWLLAYPCKQSGMPRSFVPKDRTAKDVDRRRQKIQCVVFPAVEQHRRFDRRRAKGCFLSQKRVDQVWKLRLAYAGMKKVHVDIAIEASGRQTEPVANPTE